MITLTSEQAWILMLILSITMVVITSIMDRLTYMDLYRELKRLKKKEKEND